MNRNMEPANQGQRGRTCQRVEHHGIWQAIAIGEGERLTHGDGPQCAEEGVRACMAAPADIPHAGVQILKRGLAAASIVCLALFGAVTTWAAALPYAIADTGQTCCFDAHGRNTTPPAPGETCYGQDAQYDRDAPTYRDNRDGTITDLVTGLMWTRDPGAKVTWQEAAAGASACRTGGYSDWCLPSIKDLYSLILFSGRDVHPHAGNSCTEHVPFIDTDVFHFQYGDPSRGERMIDSQFATTTIYGSTTMDGNKTMFGVNFADGRIKGYPIGAPRRGGPRREKTYHVLYVRGNRDYGRNDYVDNGDGTITDRATGLTWQKADSGKGMNWVDALAYAETLELGGHSDWRLPNAKELQSIVDYSRAPDTTHSAAIDRIFSVSAIRNEAGQPDFPCFWTSTTHAAEDGRADTAVYIAFGRAMGYMRGRWLDVHGAGAQRSDPKQGDPRRFPYGRGPQGDAIRIFNYVRCVRCN